ncbi:MAG: hypothetical protein M3544_05865 [Pseudomonadota bacterium]|nr:hypothetical protein [Pseudomonadota bacterium]
MKALQQQIETLFDRCPTLCGFSVAERSIEDAGVPEVELFVSGIDVYPALGAGQPDQLFNEISAALVELLDEHPEAYELLRARTFARTLH